MTPSTLRNRDTYLSQLLATLASKKIASNQTVPDWLLAIHSQATAFLQEETIPSNKDEEWRFTNLTGLLEQQFSTVSTAPPIVNIKSFEANEAKQRLVFVNGTYCPDLSQISAQPGLFAGNLAAAVDRGLSIEQYLAKQPGGEEVFTALNTASIEDLAVVWVTANSIIPEPVQILFIATGDQALIIQPRVLVVAERSSQVTIIEEYLHVALPDNSQFINAVAEISIGENAQVTHIHIQDQNLKAFHIGKTAVSQAQDSQYHGYAVSLGSQLSRHNWEIFQGGKQTTTNLNGLAIIGSTQVADTHSKIALNHPHGQAKQLHKCIVNGKAHGVFNGKVIVPQNAQQTSAAQLSRTLLLSPQARIDTKPQLEIMADDVKCAHGATISQLSDDELFYLQSRGLDPAASRTLLINAFAIEVLDAIPVDSVRNRLRTTFFTRCFQTKTYRDLL